MIDCLKVLFSPLARTPGSLPEFARASAEPFADSLVGMAIKWMTHLMESDGASPLDAGGRVTKGAERDVDHIYP